LGAVLYYFILKPLSLLPLSILYWLSDIFYFFVYNIIGYRKDVVTENLANAFPEKSTSERKEIAAKFYHFITDLMVEILWCFSLSEKRIRHRFNIINPELPDKFYDQGKSVALVLGHYSSWEMVLSSLNLFVKHRVATIYIPLTNKGLDKVFYKMRTVFKAKMIAKKDFRKSFDEEENELRAIIFGTDQSPSISKNIYWTQFLNQDTAVAYGVEKYAIKYDMPVVYSRLKREKRGYYSLEFETIIDQPKSTAEGEITEWHVRLLEEQIIDNPEFWLWSHKRWKKKRDIKS
jgi:KDO2-lipid IV(A) lauroyltransferase